MAGIWETDVYRYYTEPSYARPRKIVDNLKLDWLDLRERYYSPKPNIKIPSALDNALQNHTDVKTIALHLDSDFAGKSAARSITDQLGNRYVIRDEPPPVGKDCNDYLMHIRYQNRSKRMGSPRHEPAR